MILIHFYSQLHLRDIQYPEIRSLQLLIQQVVATFFVFASVEHRFRISSNTCKVAQAKIHYSDSCHPHKIVYSFFEEVTLTSNVKVYLNFVN